MALSWFKKKKASANKGPHDPAEEQVVSIPENEKSAAASSLQETDHDP